MRTELLVRILNATLSFVPIKLVEALVPLLPVVCHSCAGSKVYMQMHAGTRIRNFFIMQNLVLQTTKRVCVLQTEKNLLTLTSKMIHCSDRSTTMFLL
jgi:hypothetical protein